MGFALSYVRFSTFRRRARAVTHQAITTHPPTHHHSSTSAVEQYVPTNPQRQRSTHHSGTLVVMGKTSCGTPGAGGDLHLRTILRLPEESASRPRERIFMPPARGVGSLSAVVLPGTPRADVWGGRGTGVGSLGAGWRAVKRRVVSVLF